MGASLNDTRAALRRANGRITMLAMGMQRLIAGLALCVAAAMCAGVVHARMQGVPPGPPQASPPQAPPPPAAPPAAPAVPSTPTGPRGSQADATTTIAKAEEHFADVKRALREFHAAFPVALTATVREGRTRETKTQPCAAAMREATDEGNAARKELGRLATRAENRWKATRDTVRRVPEQERAQLTWYQDEQAISTALRRGGVLEGMVSSPASKKANESHLTTLWSRVQEYAEHLPACLPAAKADTLMPRTAYVPCLGKHVKLRP